MSMNCACEKNVMATIDASNAEEWTAERNYPAESVITYNGRVYKSFPENHIVYFAYTPPKTVTGANFGTPPPAHVWQDVTIYCYDNTKPMCLPLPPPIPHTNSTTISNTLNINDIYQGIFPTIPILDTVTLEPPMKIDNKIPYDNSNIDDDYSYDGDDDSMNGDLKPGSSAMTPDAMYEDHIKPYLPEIPNFEDIETKHIILGLAGVLVVILLVK